MTTWLQHAKATYAAGKAKDGSYKYAQALKDAGKTWKTKKGASGKATQEVAKAPKKRRRRKKAAKAEAEPEEQAPAPKKKRRGRASAAPDKLYKSVDSKALR